MEAPNDSTKQQKNLPFRKRFCNHSTQGSSSQISDTPSESNMDKAEVMEPSLKISKECDHNNPEAKNVPSIVTIEHKQGTPSEEQTIIPVTVISLPSTSSALSKKSPFCCGHCKKEFFHRGDMNKHLRTHTKEQPYSCKHCHLKFSHTSNLYRHLRIHTGSRPYSCTHCNKSFARADKLQSHRKSKFCEKNKGSQ